jgi:putative transposase
VYNYFLNQKITQYKETGKSDNYYTQAKVLSGLKKEEETEWLKEVNAQSLQSGVKNLDVAYQNFFKGRGKFPRFKSKKDKNSFSVPQNGKLINNKLHIPKFKNGIKCVVHRNVIGTTKSMTISLTPTGKYFVSILTEQNYEPKSKTGKVIGIDLGLKDFAIDSEGNKFKNHKHTKKYEKKLAKAQKHLSRKKKGSSSFEKQRRKVAKIHEKVSNTRKDVLHKVSNYIITEYDVIALEDLNIKGMVKNKKLSKHISDASWGTFVMYLQYKADWNNKKVVKIDRFFPSSKTCNICGDINKDLKLSDREWTCKNGHKLDRDINAAKNILKEGLKIYSAGTVDNTGGGINKTSISEAQACET